MLTCRFSKQWADLTTRDASAVACATTVWMEFHLQQTWTTKFIVSMIIIGKQCFVICVLSLLLIFPIRMFAPKCAACGKGITPVEGTEETVRVVSMNKDFHVDCYICEDCGIQLTDEPDKRCYPLEGCLLCRSCHLTRISNDPSEPTVALGFICLEKC